MEYLSMPVINAVILAAGSASRFGAAKQLLCHNGKSLVQRCVDVANAVFDTRVVVVVGANGQEVQSSIHSAEAIVNPQWQQGLGTSLACGVLTLDTQCDGVCILLADQVEITADHLTDLVNAFDGHNTVCAQSRGRRGVPAIFPRALFAELAHLSGDTGAKSLLQRLTDNVIAIDMPEAAIDIDTPKDWANYLERQNPSNISLD